MSSQKNDGQNKQYGIEVSHIPIAPNKIFLGYFILRVLLGLAQGVLQLALVGIREPAIQQSIRAALRTALLSGRFGLFESITKLSFKSP